MIGYQLMNFNPDIQCLISLKTKDTSASKSFINKVTECGVIVFTNGMRDMLIVFQNISRKWGLPKGYMTQEEQNKKQFFKCAKRELFEETGIDLRTVTHTKYGTLVIGNKLFYIVEVKSHVRINVIDTHEISEVRWIPRNELCSFVLTHNCNATLNKLF
jgi:8-oxo-dGTP pyrophosphatase MutT (NUDIX family)